jgi:hypothetical protein
MTTLAPFNHLCTCSRPRFRFWRCEYCQKFESHLGYWKFMVRGTASGDEAKLDEAAAICLQTAEAGKPCGTWHAVSVAYGRLDRCPCMPCSKARDKEKIRSDMGGDPYYSEI